MKSTFGTTGLNATIGHAGQSALSCTMSQQTRLRRALEREEFFLQYQPQFSMKTGMLTGVEALLRWASPELGLVMPGDFISIAEQTELILDLGAWCLRTACRDVRALEKRLGRSITLAVNISPKQVHSKSFIDSITNALQSSGFKAQRLELEITESVLTPEREAMCALKDVQKLGVSLVMDDFGMGSSKLDYITRLKVSRLKIDRHFVAGCLHDRSSEMIVRSIIFLARSLGIAVTAEGVETKAQASILLLAQCDHAQGDLFSRPTSLLEIGRMVELGGVPKLSKALLKGVTDTLTAEAPPAAPGPATVIKPSIRASAPPAVQEGYHTVRLRAVQANVDGDYEQIYEFVV